MYRAVQPLGLVVALSLPDDTVIFESAAMVHYLSNRHEPGLLSPRSDEPEQAQHLHWLYFKSGTVYSTYIRYCCLSENNATNSGRCSIVFPRCEHWPGPT
ncbi:MAG: hypothetical protein AAF499_02700 [Pseudomonadota bacterium]